MLDVNNERTPIERNDARVPRAGSSGNMWPTAASARLAVLALAVLAVGACAAAPAEVHVCTTPYRPFVYESPPDGADPQSSSRTVMEIPEDGDEPPEQRVTARRVSMQDFQRAYQGFDVDLFAAVSQ